MCYTVEDYSFLALPLPAESHKVEELRQAIAKAESFGYSIAKEIEKLDQQLIKLETGLAIARMESMKKHSGEKVVVLEAKVQADVAEVVQKKASLEADLKYLKHLQRLIENRCSVGQSLLANLTSQIKAGINIQG